jgi:hypothetical protein
MAVATFFWGVIITCVYGFLQSALPGEGLRKGIYFGMIMWFVYAYFAEPFSYLLCQIPFSFILIGWAFHAIIFPICGIALSFIFRVQA